MKNVFRSARPYGLIVNVYVIPSFDTIGNPPCGIGDELGTGDA